MVDRDSMYTQLLEYDQIAMTAGDQDAVAQVTVHQNAYLKGIQLATIANLEAANSTAQIELSRSGNTQLDANDNADTLATHDHYQSTASAAGGGQISLSTHIPCKIFFRAGDKIYLNARVAGNVTTSARAVLFWEFHESEL
jgi:hypothetical protein